MKPIIASGAFFPQDENGYIISPCKFNQITPSLIPILDFIIAKYQKILKDDLISIYLRGSIARGMEVGDEFDLDTFALVKEGNIRWKPLKDCHLLNQAILEKFGFTQKIEWMLSSYNENFYYKNPRLAMILKTQSLCLYGQDIESQIPPFKPDRQMMLYINWFEKDVQDYLMNENPTSESTRNILKTIYDALYADVQKYL